MNEFEMVVKALEDNNYDYSEYEVRQAIAESKREKADLISKLRQMPNWDENAQAVIFRKNIKRSIDTTSCREVLSWLNQQLKETFTEVKKGTFTYYEISNYLDNLSDKIRLFHNMIAYGLPCDKNVLNVLREDHRRFSEYMGSFDKETVSISVNRGYKRISMEDREILDKFSEVINRIMSQLEENESTLTEFSAKFINDRFPVNAVVGQKVSRILGKICKYLGLDKIKDMKETFNGDMKDYGYNYQFAKFGDSCNPFEVNRYVILSVNFCDFLYMSNGDSWASCHTIIDGGSHGFNGEYSSGTVSYAMDKHSFIFYTVDKDYKGNDFALEPKMQRAVFAYNEGVLYEGRVYPDGRDGGDQGYAAQFRNIVQELFAKVEEKNNLWTKVSTRNNYITSCSGTAYHDWNYYSDTNVTVLKEMETEGKTVHINARPKCLLCGCEHNCENRIICCKGGRMTCDRCGDSFDEDDYEAVHINGYHYCCNECAERDGFVYCNDIEEYTREEDAYCDDYDGNWYYDNDERVDTVDGNVYSSYEHAESSGYRCCEDDDEWYPLDKLFYDEYESVYFLKEEYEDTFININGHTYRSLENAAANGEDVSEFIEEEVA